jgi:outer membrane protein
MLSTSVRLFSALFAVLLLLAVPHGAQAQGGVGFVNTQRLLEETRVGKTAQEDLARLGKEKDDAISRSAQRINELKKELSGTGLNEDEEEALRERLKRLYTEHDDLVKKSNEDLRYEEARLIQFILRHADDSLRKVARERGFSMVLTDPNIVGYIDETADLTDLIIQDMNRN